MSLFKKMSSRFQLAALLFIFIALVSISSFLKSYELPFYDILFRSRPVIAIADDIVIITYSDQTLRYLGDWPLPRHYHASLVDVLSEIGAKAIIFDMIFSEPTLDDEALIESLISAKNVYFANVFSLDSQGQNQDKVKAAESLIAESREDFKPYLKGGGHINIIADVDGKVRQVPLFIEYQGRYFPHIALQAAVDSLGLDGKNIVFGKNSLVIDRQLTLPVKYPAALFVNYPGRWSRSFTVIDYLTLMQSYLNIKQGKDAVIDLRELNNKVFFVGVTATAGHDYGATPLEPVYPRLGVIASVYNSIVTGNYICQASVFIKTLINLLLYMVCLIICFRLKPLQSLFASIVLAACYGAAAWAFFSYQGFYLDVFLPLCIIAVSWICVTLYNFLEQTRKKDLLEKELDIAQQIQNSFLPNDIAKLAGFEISLFMQPAKFVAGDLYDIVEIDSERIGVFIGDVSGKGVPASLIMAQTISLFRIFAKQSDDPALVLSSLNKELAKVLAGRFVTALYLVIDARDKTFRAASAGHNPIVYYDANSDSLESFLPESGMPLGIMEESEYIAFQRTVHKNDKFILYTDGISEARDKQGNEFTPERIGSVLLKEKSQAGARIMESLKTELFHFSKGMPQFDDITIIVLAAV